MPNLDTIRYRALKPQDIVFKPLNQEREFSAVELMDLYAVIFVLKTIFEEILI